eukprot:CAMPEP_0198658020 /NCGR_PEP_ID=MMETSP1467-20131203/21632_1 /TAXON_ID=1462469 /ORGANISM="unid. sp., Strain CCMP2135" /LENGTH=89 /DNA_ID=CAMNT_0044394263 /DNA_START=72 /DNA_END=342 /DNA_ORIENTATION=+
MKRHSLPQEAGEPGGGSLQEAAVLLVFGNVSVKKEVRNCDRAGAGAERSHSDARRCEVVDVSSEEDEVAQPGSNVVAVVKLLPLACAAA